MKVKVSKKEMKESFNKIIGVPYCDIQHILTYEGANLYSCGVYGWSCDYYIINTKKWGQVVISTGYSFTENIKPPKNRYKICKKWNDKARAFDLNGDYKKARQTKTRLLNGFINEYIKTNIKENGGEFIKWKY